jgi:hypothetical protein
MSNALTFPTIDALERRTDELQARSLPSVEIQVVGKSRSGRDIRMISIGQGSCSALILGVPHPNEPLGALTVEYLIDLLLGDNAPQQMDIQWHFIKAIDPDGLYLNEQWCTQPLTLRSYMENHFRPALARQPEYSFPLQAGEYSFTQSTPENLAWQKALAITKPNFQASLHHADHGGVFHVVTENRPELSQALSELAAESGLGVNPIGDPGAQSQPFAAGVFGFPDIAAMVGGQGAIAWSAGECGARYAQDHFNTFSLTTEVPLWHDARLLDTSPSGKTLGDVLELQLSLFSELTTLLKTHAPAFESYIKTDDQREIHEAIKEWHVNADGFAAELNMAAGTVDPAIPLPTHIYALRSQLTLVAMRPAGLMRRLSYDLVRSVDSKELLLAGAEASAFLDKALACFEQDANLEPVALQKLVDIQTSSILLTLKYICSKSKSEG